jgi:hypothetical protein
MRLVKQRRSAAIQKAGQPRAAEAPSYVRRETDPADKYGRHNLVTNRLPCKVMQNIFNNVIFVMHLILHTPKMT